MNNDESYTVARRQDASELNLRIFETVRPYIKGRTLEMTSGDGLISTLFIENGLPIHLNHSDRTCCEKLYEQFRNYPLLRNVHRIDFRHPNFKEVYSRFAGAFDTLVSLNVAEHGSIDQIVIENAKILLRTRGHLIILALSDTVLYNKIDLEWQDFKNNNRQSIKEHLNSDFDILKARYINLYETSGENGEEPIILSVIVVGRKQ